MNIDEDPPPCRSASCALHGDLDGSLGGAAPAAAPSKAGQFADCDPLATEGAATFSLFGGSSVAARGGERPAREPDLGEVHAELPVSAKGKARKSFRQSVPVWFHVVSDGAIGNISNEVIQEQMKAQRRRDAWLLWRE